MSSKTEDVLAADPLPVPQPAAGLAGVQQQAAKKRPRPAKLDLKNATPNSSNSMKDYAMQCLSPGLPPLSARMKSTVLMSKSINEQQKKLIASRIKDDDSPKEASATDANANPPTATAQTAGDGPQKQANKTGLTASMESLDIPSPINKRLKRARAPPPLNLNRSAHTAHQMPSIRSAPIAAYPSGGAAYVYHPQKQRKEYPVPSSAAIIRQHMRKRSLQQSQAVPQAPPQGPPPPQRRLIASAVPPISPYHYHSYFYHPIPVRQFPKTATTNRPPPSQHLPQQQIKPQCVQQKQQKLAQFEEYRNSLENKSHVTDIFNDNNSEFAPIDSQPLSAQKKFFDLPKSYTKGIKTATKEKFPDYVKDDTYNNNKKAKENNDNANDNDNTNDDNNEDDVEDKAIEADAKPGLELKKNEQVIGEIKILNNTFKFDFERQQNSPDNDKARFLNFCSAAWNEYINLS